VAAIEDEKIYGLQIRESANDGSDFSNPAADYRLAFLGEDGLWHVKDSAGTVTNPFSSSSAALCGAKAYNAGTQSLTNNTETAVTFDSEEYDTDGIHSTSSNTERFTIPAGKDGKWRLGALVVFAGNATGQRTAYWKKTVSGPTTTYLRGGRNTLVMASSVDFPLYVETDVVLAAGDFVFVTAYQNSGGSLNIGHASDTWVQCAAWAQFLGA